MDKEKQLVIKGGVLDYRRAENEVSIIQGRAVESRMEIPDEIEGLPVTKIEKKAFLSSKQLKEIILPRKLKSIGDWAFAYCSQLKSVWLPKKNLSVEEAFLKNAKVFFPSAIWMMTA